MAADAMGPRGALRMGIMGGAHFVGAQEDIGSIRPGKLADLQILDANSMNDVRNRAKIRWVVKGGVVYEGETLEEVWARQRVSGPHTWVNDDVVRRDVRPVDG